MSRIECKYCLNSTSCLAGLSDIFILLHILHNCMYFGVFSSMLIRVSIVSSIRRAVFKIND